MLENVAKIQLHLLYLYCTPKYSQNLTNMAPKYLKDFQPSTFSPHNQSILLMFPFAEEPIFKSRLTLWALIWCTVTFFEWASKQAVGFCPPLFFYSLTKAEKSFKVELFYANLNIRLFYDRKWARLNLNLRNIFQEIEQISMKFWNFDGLLRQNFDLILKQS